jgi:hypothetical protein
MFIENRNGNKLKFMIAGPLKNIISGPFISSFKLLIFAQNLGEV